MDFISSSADSFLPTKRIEALSDGIFAIAMTILVLEFQIPDFSGLDLSDFLIRFLLTLWPKFFCYVMSFLILGVFWVGHHSQFHFIKHSDRFLLWINIFFLMSIAFLPFSTALLGRYWMERVAIIFYGCNLLSCGLILYGHWRYALARHLTLPISSSAARVAGNRILVGVVIGLTAMAVSLFRARWSIFIYAAMPFVFIIPGKIDRYWKENAS